MAAETRWTTFVFNLPSLMRRRAITYRNSAGDNLLTEWDFQEPFAAGTIVLRDTPYYSTYSMRLTADSWRSRNDLANLLTALIKWDASPIRIPHLVVSIPSDYPITAEFVGSPPQLFSSRGFIRDFYVIGRVSNDQLFIQVNVGKVFSDGLNGIAAFVPERFPPLTVLARSWNEKKILQEVGKRTDPSVGGDFSEARDLILITELARRGASEASFISLLTTVPPRELGSRAATVFRAMHDAGRDSDLDRYFQPMMAAYQGLGPSADAAVTAAFRVAKARKACLRELETSAFGLLQRGTLQDVALFYLSECSNSEDARRMLESIPVPDKFLPRKESTVLTIHRRQPQPQ